MANEIYQINSVTRPTETVEEKQAKIQETLTDSDFLAWLNMYTRTNQQLDDYDVVAKGVDNVSENQQNYLKKLYYLFEGVRLWAEKNCIPIIIDQGKGKRTLSQYFKVKIGNCGYEIGRTHDSLFHFCWRVKLSSDFIDFKDIISDRSIENTSDILKALDNLKNAIKLLSSYGYSVQQILELAANAANTRNLIFMELSDETEKTI